MNVPMVDATEPMCIDNRDYVQDPVASDSYFSSFGRYKKEPFTWLAAKKPIEWMVREKGFGLQRMLQNGVTMDDFVNNGYTWENLKAFRDFGSGENHARAREALFALKCNAEHFRDSAHLLGSMVQDLEINGRHLVELYGFYFPADGKPLSVVGGKNEKYWSGTEVAQLGMKMDDLFGAGIETLDQYIHLDLTAQDEVAMGVTQKDLDDLEQPVEEVVYVEQPRQQRIVVVAPPPPRQEYIMRAAPRVVIERPKMTRLHGLKNRK